LLHLTPDPGEGEACQSPYHGGRPCPPDTFCQDADDDTATCGERSCGDGLLSFEPLECDDGNGDSGDGCSSLCELDQQGAGSASCEAPMTLNLPRMRDILDAGEFSYAVGAGELVDGSDLSAGCATAAGPEAVYVFELPVASRIEIATEGADVVSLRRAGATDCGTEELACAVDIATNQPTLTLQLEPGRYSVILDREEPTLATTPSYLVDVFVQNR
jgi:cysteine-rich repeat protein